MPLALQEVERYNALLAAVRRSCAELQKGIKGLVVMSADLDAIFDALYNAKVRTGQGLLLKPLRFACLMLCWAC